MRWSVPQALRGKSQTFGNYFKRQLSATHNTLTFALSLMPSDSHGSLVEEVLGAAVPRRGTGHDPSIKQPLSALQVQVPGSGPALEDIENRQQNHCDQDSLAFLRGAICCQCGGDQLQTLALGPQIVVEGRLDPEGWSCRLCQSGHGAARLALDVVACCHRDDGTCYHRRAGAGDDTAVVVPVEIVFAVVEDERRAHPF